MRLPAAVAGGVWAVWSLEGESVNGHPERGWPALGRLHLVQVGVLRGVTVEASLPPLDFPVGVLGAEERRDGAIVVESYKLPTYDS